MQDRKFRMGLINRVSGQPIPEDEPVFIFRARDRRAVTLLRMYRDMCEDPHHRDAIQESIQAFSDWAEVNPDQMKEPGITGDFMLGRKL